MITIHVPKTLESELGLSHRLQGFFTVELIDAKTGLVKRKLEFPNLITDAGLNALGAGSFSIGQLVSYMGVGTGNTPPTAADTTLVAQLARTNFTQGFVDVAGYGPANAYTFYRVVRVFTEAQANGNLTEVGMFQTNVGGTMWTRQLLKDGTGTPTVITKTAADQLRVTYEWRLNIPSADNGGTINISGTNYDWTNRPYHVDTDWDNITTDFPGLAFIPWSMAQWALETDVLVAITAASLAGTQTISDSHSGAAYVSGNFYRDVENVWEPGTANYGTGVGAVITSSSRFALNGWYQTWQTKFSPKIPKTNVKRLKLTFRHFFQRVP